MSWGDAAAEQWEKDQPSTYAPPEVCSFCGAHGPEIGIGDDGMCINVYKCQERHDLRETPAETVLDADERRGD